MLSGILKRVEKRKVKGAHRLRICSRDHPFVFFFPLHYLCPGPICVQASLFTVQGFLGLKMVPLWSHGVRQNRGGKKAH